MHANDGCTSDRDGIGAPQQHYAVCPTNGHPLSTACFVSYDELETDVVNFHDLPELGRHSEGTSLRRVAFLAVCAVAVSSVASHENAAAQSLAGRQIRLIVPFPAGGPTHILARPFAQMLGDPLKSIIVIDNRGGAGGSLGGDGVGQGAPHCRTRLHCTG